MGIYLNPDNSDFQEAFKATPHKARLTAWRRICLHFSAILHENSLLGVSPAASFSYNLTKNLTAHLHHQLCAVLPQLTDLY